MALYYFTADYSGEAFSGMVNSPQDREAAARELIEAVGMKLHNFYFCVNTGQIIGMIEGTGSQMSILDWSSWLQVRSLVLKRKKLYLHLK